MKIEVALCIAMGLGACDDTPVDPTIAKAMQTESKTEKVQKQLAETEKKKQDETRRAKEEKQATQEAELEAAVKLPDVMPETLDAACDAMVDAYDDFMKRGAEKDVLDWWKPGRRGQLALVRRDKCERVGSIPAAACSSVALMQPLDSLFEIERTESAKMVIDRCVKKFAKS
jgi:hypothetical protein